MWARDGGKWGIWLASAAASAAATLFLVLGEKEEGGKDVRSRSRSCLEDGAGGGLAVAVELEALLRRDRFEAVDHAASGDDTGVAIGASL